MKKNIGVLNTYIKSIESAKSKYIMLLEEEGMILPYLKNVMDLVSTFNRDITNFICLKGTFGGIIFDDKVEDGEKTQPELSESYYNENFIIENPLLNKVFKTEIYIIEFIFLLKRVTKNWKNKTKKIICLK